MIKDTAKITTIEMAALIGHEHESVVLSVKVMLLATKGRMSVDEYLDHDFLNLPYKEALLTAGAFSGEKALKIIEFLEAQ